MVRPLLNGAPPLVIPKLSINLALDPGYDLTSTSIKWTELSLASQSEGKTFGFFHGP